MLWKIIKKLRQYVCKHDIIYYYNIKNKYIFKASHGRKNSKCVERYNVYEVERCSKCNKKIRTRKVATNITYYKMLTKYIRQ